MRSRANVRPMDEWVKLEMRTLRVVVKMALLVVAPQSARVTGTVGLGACDLFCL
jgi:hypothetical protein